MTGLQTLQVLWANFQGELQDRGKINCFPFNADYQFRLDDDEIKYLITQLSPLYQQLVSSIARQASKATGVGQYQCEIILREPIVLAAYCLIDRLVRLSKVLSNQDLNQIYAPKVNFAMPPKDVGNLMKLIDGSPKFNQYLISEFSSSIWNIPIKVCQFSQPEFIWQANAEKNLNFEEPNLYMRVLRKLKKTISRKLGKYIAFRLVNMDDAFLDAGLYGFGRFIWFDEFRKKESPSKDEGLRNELTGKIYEDIYVALESKIFCLLKNITLKQKVSAAKIYSKLLVECISTDRLEGLTKYEKYEDFLKTFKTPAIYFSSTPANNDIFVIAAAKATGVPVIGIQHGAHYGFSVQPCHVELEYAYCDKFISWGWRDMVANRYKGNIEIIPLPSPWLSERKKKWSKLLSRAHVVDEKKYDVLWMTDRLQYFPPSISTLRMSRQDCLQSLNESMEYLVSELVENNIQILHKPFNYISRDIQITLLRSLASKYPSNYTIYEKLDKGLTIEMVENVKLVLWDEPGTGFFECLLAGIPTMVLWGRLTSWEVGPVRYLFAELEEVGLMHQGVDTLLHSLNSFLEDKSKWMINQRRIEVIKKVIERFSYTHDDWQNSWKRSLA